MRRKRKKATPYLINDVESNEIIYGPPATVRSEEDLRFYQRWMANRMILFDVFMGAYMGLGKTAASLWAIKRMLDRGKVSNVLIVAPLAVAEHTWPSEIAGWTFARGLSYRVVIGSAEEREAALALKDRQITIINRENVVWLYKKLGGPQKWPFDCLVYDEGTRLSSNRLRSVVSKRKDGSTTGGNINELGVLNRIRSRFKRVVVLSGSPTARGLLALWGPMVVVDGGAALGNKFKAFKERWFNEYRLTHEIEPKFGAEEEIMSRLRGKLFTLRSKDYLDLPRVILVDRMVYMTPEEKRKYKFFERERAAEFFNEQGEEEIVEAVNGGVLTGKLLQLANGAVYANETREVIEFHDHKIKELESIVAESGGAPILVAYSFDFDKARILKRFPNARVFGESKNDLRDWNAGKISMLIVHPQSAGHGMNFQYGSNICVWFGLTWSLEYYDQFSERLPRSGQKHDHVFMYRILTAGTKDEDVRKALAEDNMTQERLNARVRASIERTLWAA